MAAIVILLKNPVPMSCAMVAIIVARFLCIGRRGDWLFLALGIVAGGGNDLLSMFKGVYYYTPRDFLNLPIPLWMLLFWGYVFVAFRQLFTIPVFGNSAPDNPWRLDARLAADLAVVILFRIIIYNFVRHEPLPTIGYAAVLATRLLLIPPRKHEWLLMAAVMLIGPLVEAVLIHSGLYVYYDPVFFGMPAWLLIYWAFIIPIFMKGVFDRVEKALTRNTPSEIS